MIIFLSCAGNRLTKNQAVPVGDTDTINQDASLFERYWQVIQLNGTSIQCTERSGREAHIIFNVQDSRISGSGGCNQFSGYFEVNGNQIRISNIISTKMACMNVPYENEFFGFLQEVNTYEVSRDTLKLFADGVIRIKFINEAPVSD